MSSNDATQSSPLFVPSALQFYVNRLSFSKNRVRLQALSTQVASASSQVIVRLPSNTMINMASLTMTGGVRAKIDNPDPDLKDGCALPTNWDFSFIESLSLIANGGIITQPFTNYKLLGNTLNDVYGNDDKNMSRNALQGSLPHVLHLSYNQVGAPTDRSQGYQPFCINNWLSATQTMAPSYISTNLLGDLELRLTMTTNDVVQSGSLDDGVARPGLQARCSWDMAHLNFYVETASIESNMLDQAIAAKLAGGEPINVPFENVFSFQQSNQSGNYNQRFSVSSQSVNKILAVSQLNSQFNRPTNNSGVPQNVYHNGIPSAFRRSSCGARFAQFSVNNQYSPNYQIDSQVTAGLSIETSLSKNYTASNILVETRAAMDIPDYDYDSSDKLTSTTQMPFEFLGSVANVGSDVIQPPADMIMNFNGAKNAYHYWFPYTYKAGIDTFLDDKYLLATSFDLDVSDKDRLVSGINTLGSNAQMFLNVIGGANRDHTVPPTALKENGENTSTVFVLCTSMIQIYQGATLQIIQ